MRLVSSSYCLNISEITETHGNCLNANLTKGGNRFRRWLYANLPLGPVGSTEAGGSSFSH